MRQLDRQQVRLRPSAAAETRARDAAPRSAPRLGVLAALLGVGALLAATTFLATTRGLAVRRVVVEGAVHADPRELARAAGVLGENLLSLDLEAARERVLEQPWVEDATLRRVLPHELHVRVRERVPIAREQVGDGSYVVDSRGVVLDEAGDEGERDLPLMLGTARESEDEHVMAREQAAATLGALFAETPALYARIESIDASQPDRLVVLADGAPQIWMRGPESTDEVSAWLQRERGLARRLGEASYVDARWRDRLYILPKKFASRNWGSRLLPRGLAISRPSETHVGSHYARLSSERDLANPRGASWRPEFPDAHQAGLNVNARDQRGQP